jgi:hypothetical protein
MKKIVLVLILLISNNLLAAEFPGLKKYVNENIEAVKASLNEAATADDSGEGWFFKDIYIRLQAKIGYEVPWIASFQIIPEVELVFLRPLPEGTVIYKPD